MISYKKFSKLIGLPIISNKSGLALGFVCDVLFSSEKMRVEGFIARVGKIIRVQRFLNISDALNISNSQIQIKDSSSLLPFKKFDNSHGIKSYIKHIKGAQVNHCNIKLGSAADVLFNAEFGEITFFEISDGFIEDVLKGRRYITANNDIFFGNNNIEVLNKNNKLE